MCPPERPPAVDVVVGWLVPPRHPAPLQLARLGLPGLAWRLPHSKRSANVWATERVRWGRVSERVRKERLEPGVAEEPA